MKWEKMTLSRGMRARQQRLPPRKIVGRAGRGQIVQLPPCSLHRLLEPLLPCPKIKGRRGKFGDRLEDFRRSLPQPLEWTRRFAAAAQWTRIDWHAIQRLCEHPSRCFGLLLAGSAETRIRVFAPACRGAGVSDQIESCHALDSAEAARRGEHASKAGRCCSAPPLQRLIGPPLSVDAIGSMTGYALLGDGG